MSIAGTTSITFETQDTARHRPAYASFGENGLTATATAYGDLLQITQYFGNDPSGFYCVDLQDVPEPYLVTQRMEHLQSYTVHPDKGMRLEIANINTPGLRDDIPKLSFLNNRWPNFKPETVAGDFNTEIQYFIHQKTVYQTYTFTSRGESSASLPEMTFNPELLIRDLDFSNSSIWNMQGKTNSSYRHRSPQGKHCILRIHKIGAEQDNDANQSSENNGNAVVLAIWPFIDDSPQSVQYERTTAKYKITPGSQVLNRVKKVSVTVTLAYTLHFVPCSQVEDISPPIAPMKLLGKLKADAETNETSFANPLFSDDNRLDLALKRNLEHILSVCSIPVGDGTKNTIPPTAITCGDMSGHKVANEASFSAFQTLLLAFRHFHEELDTKHLSHMTQNNTCDSFGCQMRSRIWKVCRGHLKWITELMKAGAGIVESHYWATGRPIGAKYGSPLPLKSLMETPFHIIKVAEFCRIIQDKTALDEVREELEHTEVIKNWVETLDRENKHGLYAFPRPRKEALIHSFYFPDHAIIWWATKSVEDLGLGQKLQIEDSACASKHKSRNKSYSSDEIRTNTIKRFTTENPVLKKRMIAISRTTIETRFLIREKETVLFSALDRGMLDKSPDSSEKIGVWANTMDCQAQHEDNQNTQWDHPLQFALAIIMSANGVRINSKPVAEMLRYSKSVLLNSSSPNGLFPGQLDEDKEPAIFMKDTMCDSYWRATFEVPYILWRHAKALSTNAAETNGSSHNSNTHASIQVQFTKQENSYMTSKELDQAMDKMFERLSAAFFAPGLSTINGKLAIKKSVPFKNFIDQNNIVELQDEWMYNEPKFFDFECNLAEDCNLKAIVEDDEFLTMSEKETFHRVGNVIANAIDLVKEFNATIYTKSPIMGYMVNVPRRSPSIKEHTKSLIRSNPEIYKLVGGKRTPETSKKRLFHFSKADLATALICYLASSEKSKISSFFDRHAAYDKYFFDEVTPETNKWITEFHLSFYRILGRGTSSEIDGIPLLEEIEYPHPPRMRDGRRISRAVISFRFDGDYFDRYWTCHFFEFNPKELPESDWELRNVVNKHFGAISKANPWRQRRVLELLIVSTMLQEILLSSQAILEEIKKSIQNSANRRHIGQQPPASALLDTFDLFTKIDNGRFVAISRLWYKFQHILQIVENDLQENLAKITLWNDRERARGYDKPRWTKSDERDYRPIISKLQAHNDHKYHELQRCYVNITSFNASLSTNLDKMRGDLELRGADDIRLFTYVTVIFLPVGFATGIFSMSDTPSSHTLICMAITAVVALLVTIIALTNAKSLDNKVVGPILRSSRKSLYSSVGRPLRIIYSALKIRFRPCIYYFGRYVYFPIMNRYKNSNLVMELMEEFGRELFDMADSLSPWEHAYEDYSKSLNKLPMDTEQNWGDSIGRYTKSFPQRMGVRFRGGNKTTVETGSARGSV